MRLLAFCEAPDDFRIAADLVDRALREAGPGWVGDVLDTAPEAVLTWGSDGAGRTFFDLHKLRTYTEQLAVRPPYGHFDGSPGGHGALMARTVFWIVRSLLKRGEAVDAVVLIWDMDNAPRARRAGLAQAEAEANQWAPFRIVIGCPNAMREAWVLAGFEPEHADEEALLADVRRDLGFAPNVEPHRLDSNDELAKRNAKRVLRILTGGDKDREVRCWTATRLETMRTRGGENGLRDYLDAIERQLLPLLVTR